MPDITFDYTPSTGSVLVPADYNKNLYQTTSGKSLFETLNGNVTYPNLNASFAVQTHLIRPGQTGIARSDGRVFSADYFSDIWSGPQSLPYTPIGGAAITCYVPYDMSVAILSASVFLTVWRQFGEPDTSAPSPFVTRRPAPPVVIQTFMGDNDGIVYTRRELPQTVFFEAGVQPDANIRMVEQYTCHHYNLLHARMAGKSSPNGPLTKGYATFGLAVFVAQNGNGSDTGNSDYRMNLIIGGSGDERPSSYYKGINRVRTYVRNATVMGLL